HTPAHALSAQVRGRCISRRQHSWPRGREASCLSTLVRACSKLVWSRSWRLFQPKTAKVCLPCPQWQKRTLVSSGKIGHSRVQKNREPRGVHGSLRENIH